MEGFMSKIERATKIRKRDYECRDGADGNRPR
jgi:hypothetical protein